VTRESLGRIRLQLSELRKDIVEVNEERALHGAAAPFGVDFFVWLSPVLPRQLSWLATGLQVSRPVTRQGPRTS
jgi:hypothetical protein